MATTVKAIGPDIIMPSGGTVDGIDLSVAVPAAQSDATAALAVAAASVQPARTLTAGNGLTGGGNLSADRSFACSFGSSVNTVCQGNDARLSDARTPSAHASSHVTGGSDVIAAAVSGGASGLMTGTDKAKCDAAIVGMWHLSAVAANAAASARYFQRSTGPLQSTRVTGEFCCGVSGTRTFTLTLIVGIALVTDTTTITLVINGSATAVTFTVAAGGTTGTASGSIAVNASDRIAVSVVQSGTEVQVNWNGVVVLTAK